MKSLILCLFALVLCGVCQAGTPLQAPLPPQYPSYTPCGKVGCTCGCMEGQVCRCALKVSATTSTTSVPTITRTVISPVTPSVPCRDGVCQPTILHRSTPTYSVVQPATYIYSAPVTYYTQPIHRQTYSTSSYPYLLPATYSLGSYSSASCSGGR